MSRFFNNKHYIEKSAYHGIRVNNNTSTKKSIIINVARDTSLHDETILACVVISPTVSDNKLVEHAVERDGSFNFYSRYRNQSNINFNTPTIMTTYHKRATWSSKVEVAAAGEGSESSPAVKQIWYG